MGMCTGCAGNNLVFAQKPADFKFKALEEGFSKNFQN
jgi:hypothetical protein